MNSNEPFLGLFQFGCQAMLNAMNVSLAGAERIRALQLKSIREAMSDTAEAARQISSSKTFDDLFQAQQNVSRGQIEKATGRWSELCEAASQGNAEVLKLVQDSTAQLSGTCGGMAGSGPVAAEPVMAALQSLANLATHAYANASKDVMQLAVSQFAAAGAERRHSGGEAKRKLA